MLRVFKSRRMKWIGYIACFGGMINAYIILVGKPEGKTPLRRPRRTRRIMLEWILGKSVGKCGLVASGSVRSKGGLFYEQVNESLISIKGGEFHD
jgi:hypothetical protein